MNQRNLDALIGAMWRALQEVGHIDLDASEVGSRSMEEFAREVIQAGGVLVPKALTWRDIGHIPNPSSYGSDTEALPEVAQALERIARDDP